MNTNNCFKSLCYIKRTLEKIDLSSVDDDTYFFNSTIYALTECILSFYLIDKVYKLQSYNTACFTRSAIEGKFYLTFYSLFSNEDKRFFRIRNVSLYNNYLDKKDEKIIEEEISFLKKRGITKEIINHPFYWCEQLSELSSYHDLFKMFPDKLGLELFLYEQCSLVAHDFPFMEKISTDKNKAVRNMEKKYIDELANEVVKEYSKRYGSIPFDKEKDFNQRLDSYLPESFIEYINSLQDVFSFINNDLTNNKYPRYYSNIITLYTMISIEIIHSYALDLPLFGAILFKSSIDFLASTTLIKDKVKEKDFNKAYDAYLNHRFIDLYSRNQTDKYEELYKIIVEHDGEHLFNIYKSFYRQGADYKTFIYKMKYNPLFFVLNDEKPSFRKLAHKYIGSFIHDDVLKQSYVNMYNSGVEASHFMNDSLQNHNVYKNINFDKASIDHLYRLFELYLKELVQDFNEEYKSVNDVNTLTELYKNISDGFFTKLEKYKIGLLLSLQNID